MSTPSRQLLARLDARRYVRLQAKLCECLDTDVYHRLYAQLDARLHARLSRRLPRRLQARLQRGP